MNRNILFLLHTEFHVLMASSIIHRYFGDPDEYNVQVVLHTSSKGNRFKFHLHFGHLPVEFHKIQFDSHEVEGKSPALHKLLEYLSQFKFEKYISFLEHAPLNWYLANRLSRQGTRVCLAPEGTKPYITISRFAFPSRFKQSLRNYRFLKKEKLGFRNFYFVRNTHATLSSTEEVWVTNKSKYQNKTHKEVREIEILSSPENIKAVSKVFNFQLKDHLEEDKNLIIYFNHWVVEKKIYDVEIDMLQAIRRMFPEKQIIIKLHPNTPRFQIDRFEKVEGVRINTSTKPAELFIANVNNSLILSYWSASLLYDNPTCNFFWLHPYLKRKNVLPRWFSIVNPTDHIQEVDKLGQLHAN